MTWPRSHRASRQQSPALNVLLSLLTLTSLCLKTAATPPAHHIPYSQQNWTQPYFVCSSLFETCPSYAVSQLIPVFSTADWSPASSLAYDSGPSSWTWSLNWSSVVSWLICPFDHICSLASVKTWPWTTWLTFLPLSMERIRLTGHEPGKPEQNGGRVKRKVVPYLESRWCLRKILCKN